MARYAGLLGTSALVLSAAGVGLLVAFGDRVALVDPLLDTAIQTVIVLGSMALAALSWVRYRTVEDVASLYLASAFLLIAAFAGLTLVLRLLHMGGALEMDLAHPGQTPLYLSSAIRLTAGVLILIGALAASAGSRAPRPAVAILLGPTLALALALPIIRVVGPSLPPLIQDLSFERLIEGRRLIYDPATAPFFAAAQALTVGVFAAAALAYTRLYRRDGAIVRAYLAVALAVGAVGQVGFTVSPGSWHGLVTAEDAASAVAYILVLLGAEAQTRADARTLQEANQEIRLMRDTFVERAALDERARLAREVHDGLAQELWFATLRLGRLAAIPNLPANARELVSEIGASIDSSLAEARQAVMALTGETHEEPLYHVLTRYTEELGDRFGILVEADIAQPLPLFPTRTQAEILRIVQEAVNNVVKHADATTVRLVASMQGSSLVIRLSDNGRGFDPRRTGASSFGIRSMTQRAEALGGRLTIESADRDGTVVELLVPAP